MKIAIIGAGAIGGVVALRASKRALCSVQGQAVAVRSGGPVYRQSRGFGHVFRVVVDELPLVVLAVIGVLLDPAALDGAGHSGEASGGEVTGSRGGSGLRSQTSRASHGLAVKARAAKCASAGRVGVAAKRAAAESGPGGGRDDGLRIRRRGNVVAVRIHEAVIVHGPPTGIKDAWRRAAGPRGGEELLDGSGSGGWRIIGGHISGGAARGESLPVGQGHLATGNVAGGIGGG